MSFRCCGLKECTSPLCWHLWDVCRGGKESGHLGNAARGNTKVLKYDKKINSEDEVMVSLAYLNISSSSSSWLFNFYFLSMLIDSTSGITFAQKSQNFFTREKVAKQSVPTAYN